MKFIYFLFFLLSVISKIACDKVITIENGRISGDEKDNFIAFRGIRYAESPTGDLRWAPPKPYLEKWDGVKEFKEFSDVCAQYDHITYDFLGVEDCLMLNVFVPKSVLESNEKVPVIFFIHGGAFMLGSGSYYKPENIMKGGNMILVTVNYRLGVLGFLSTEDDVIPGNFGLKDQSEALRWVQRNIEAFNGDKNQVTLVGFSAGGASAHLHYMSRLSNGLFHNGISHSGCALNPWVMMENARKKAHKIASHTNCPESHDQLLKCLREKPAKELVLLAKLFQPFMFNPFSPFGVVVEPNVEGAFLTEQPIKLLEAGNFKKVPWLLSQTKDEGLYPGAEFYDDKILKTLNDQFSDLFPHILDFDGLTEVPGRKMQISHRIKRHYMGFEPIGQKSFKVLVEILSDRHFHSGAIKAIQLHSRHAPAYIYTFRFKSLSGLTEYMTKSNKNLGVGHGEDVLLIFGPMLRTIPLSEEEQQAVDYLTKLYYNFAKFDQAVYNGVYIEKSKPDDVKALEISYFDASQVEHVTLDDHFGNSLFWDAMEQILTSKERTAFDSTHDEL